MPKRNHFPRPPPILKGAWKAADCASSLPIHSPLTEVCSATPWNAPAAIGFALAWALAQANGLLLWAFPEHLENEHGALYAEGLAQFGAPLERLVFVRAANQTDAVWAIEQALAIPGAVAICTISSSPKGMSLTASRRLILLTEKHRSRCVLVRFDEPSASAAWVRFSVQSAPSQAEARELGAPAFDVLLTRNRSGPAGQSWRLIWNAQTHAFISSSQRDDERALDGDLAASAVNRQVAPHRRRAV